jgi:excisionase family DNA binding protein
MGDFPAISREAGSLTYSIDEFARMLRIGRSKAYAEAQQKGEIAGVRVIRIGRLYRVPKAPADKLLNGEIA